MKRSALIAGVSLTAVLMAGPVPVWAMPGDIDAWSGGIKFSTPSAPPADKSSRPRLRNIDKASRKSEPADKTPPIPSGPLHIIVSIDRQRATLFADGNPVASTAVSTGTPGHPTPMGVFTVIQKDRHHVSNLYNASMPYMQRITWSGSALHEGPLPGYPASHGCVRLTSNFAQFLWKATKMGARVIVTKPDVAPVEFEHARLFVPKPKLADAATAPVTTAVAAAVPLPVAKPAAISTSAPVVAAPAAAAVAAEPAANSPAVKVRTADAGNSTAVAVLSVSGDDAKPAVTSVVTEPIANRPAPEQPTKLAETDPADATAKPAEAPATNAAAPSEAKPAPAAEAETVEAKPAEAKPAQITAEEAAEAPVAEAKPAEAPVAETKAVETKPAEPATVEVKSPVIAAPAPIIVDERPKTMPAAVAQEAVAGRPISVFVSLKEGKLYVRQGWKALFDAPVSFENPGQPIGTHIYTAMGVKAEGPALRWTVVSIPSGYRRMAELRNSEHSRKPRNEPPVKASPEVSAPALTPAAALDRIIMPPELVERISEMITPGSSLIVSDNRLSDETGDDTDFIVLTH